MEDSQIDALERRILALEHELAELRPLAAAAREAHAFFAGRRPGFAPSYPKDIIHAACAPGSPKRPARPRKSQPKTRGRKLP